MIHIFHCGECPGGCYISTTDGASTNLDPPIICPYIRNKDISFKEIKTLPKVLQDVKKMNISRWLI